MAPSIGGGQAMARPLGPEARAVLARLALGPASISQLSIALGLTSDRLDQVCYRLRVAGRISVASWGKTSGCWRPTALYSLRGAANVGAVSVVAGWFEVRA